MICPFRRPFADHILTWDKVNRLGITDCPNFHRITLGVTHSPDDDGVDQTFTSASANHVSFLITTEQYPSNPEIEGKAHKERTFGGPLAPHAPTSQNQPNGHEESAWQPRIGGILFSDAGGTFGGGGVTWP